MARSSFLRRRLLPGFMGAGLRRRLLPALVGASTALVLGAPTAAASTQGYGELGHFGSAGTGHGQFQLPRETHAYAFGVDPTDNSVYVGDEPSGGEYRVQKLSATGQFLAAVSFKPSNPANLEGIAVDPAKERVYVLAVAFRSESASIDHSKRAAGTLYAFKTKASGEALESAVSGASKEAKEGVLANPTTLETESEVQGHALLDPGGIAVDPATHDVIVMGQEDQGGGGESPLRVALERVSEKGALGHRYVDATNCFGGKGSAECEEGGVEEPNSPAVSQTGRVYVEGFDRIWEISSDFTSSQPPKSFIQFNPLVEGLVEFPGNPVTEAGGGLSLVPEGASEGTLYIYANILQKIEGKPGFKYPGALAFKYTEKAGVVESTELGWTGGQSAATGGGKCTISFKESPSLAAGKEGDLFVFDPAPATPKHPSANPHVVEFGPGGTGCPTASASAPSATVKGEPVTEVPPGAKVTLSSTVAYANALSVEWSFGDGTAETVSTDEFQTTKVIHEYTLPGEHTITETIHTDDRQTPEVVVEGKLTVTGGVGEGVTITTQPVAQVVEEGKTATFAATASGTPTPTAQWQVSTNNGGTWTDVPGATSDTLNVAHTTMSENGYEYRAVFTNSSGSKETEPAKLTVKEKQQEKEKPKEEKPKETIVPPPPGGGGVLGEQTTHAPPPVPDAQLASTTLETGTSGAVAIGVSCPASESSCAGTVTLRTLGAVSARAAGRSRAGKGKKKSKAAVLTLASGTFTVAGGRVATVTLHLSAKARALLARSHVMRVQATIVAHDPTGASHTTQTTVTLRAAKAKHGHGKH